ncbi:uncharacterized protein LOC129597994 [Paramacrobiotus metropolitanus]|uniref:uncharacterized protein LOC129597994 n=1 Tax=Paramacrobiotus metropolitanus TaxID=2943436 RepID=UPI0024458730|nr:uncharacterized protein LOC129597994 [Paramacrobiotus metropolitanus]
MEPCVTRSWKRQSRCLDFQQIMEPLSDGAQAAGTFAPYTAVEPDTLGASENPLLWWKIFGLTIHDLYDWRMDKIDDLTCTFYGLLGTSPYFDAIPLEQQKLILSMMTLSPKRGDEMFADLTEKFRGQMEGDIVYKKIVVNMNGYQLGIFRFGSKVYAVENVCPHMQGPLGMGDIEEIDGRVCVICPWHHWRFELDTGRPLQPPRKNGARVFPVKNVDCELFVGFEGYNPVVFTDDFF